MDFSSLGQDLRQLYQELILDHNKNPRNYTDMEYSSHSAHGHNPLCGDRLTVYLHIRNNIIEDISFTGSGCAISKASSSIMTEVLKGKSLSEAKHIFKNFHKMVTSGVVDIDEMGKLSVLAGVYKYPARVKCAVLAWHTMINAIDESRETVTTE